MGITPHNLNFLKKVENSRKISAPGPIATHNTPPRVEAYNFDEDKHKRHARTWRLLHVLTKV
jgi:hypothetical protein